MDSLITAAARALAAGDAFAALNFIALREDAAALALRGIAMAQLGDLGRAKSLLRRAARAFGAKETVSRARCVVAEAEVAFAARDLGWPVKTLDAARVALEAHGDIANATHARYLAIRRLLLIGRLTQAESLLASSGGNLPPAMRVVHELIVAGIAIRRVQAESARVALARAARAASAAGIPALVAEVENTVRLLSSTAARLITRGAQRPLRLADVEALFASPRLIVDACRGVVRRGDISIPLAKRPVLFTLLRALAEAWPGGVSRDALVARAFRAKRADESHRARLRVEMGRLRKLMRAVAVIEATAAGFAITARGGREIVVLAQPVDDHHGTVLAFLADGESWSSSALALALGASQRTVQRALDELAAAGKVQSFGQGRARRWTTPPVPAFTTTLLLPAPLPID